MKYYLDTNFLIYLLGENEKLRKICEKFLIEHEGEYCISTLVILEVLYYVWRKNKELLKDVFEFLLENFVILDFYVEEIKEALKLNLQIFDAMHYIISRNHDAVLVTFDKDFKGLENVIILEY